VWCLYFRSPFFLYKYITKLSNLYDTSIRCDIHITRARARSPYRKTAWRSRIQVRVRYRDDRTRAVEKSNEMKNSVHTHDGRNNDYYYYCTAAATNRTNFRNGRTTSVSREHDEHTCMYYANRRRRRRRLTFDFEFAQLRIINYSYIRISRRTCGRVSS